MRNLVTNTLFKYVRNRPIWYLNIVIEIFCSLLLWSVLRLDFFNSSSLVNKLLLNTIRSALSWSFSNFLINWVILNLQTLMTVKITLVKTVALAWMASTISRVTALKGILGVIARQVCSFEAKIWLSQWMQFQLTINTWNSLTCTFKRSLTL